MPAACAAGHVDGRRHSRGLSKAEQARVERPVCLHGTLVPVCAECATVPQVKAIQLRPAPGDPGAALRVMVTNETTLNAARASIRHDAQVCRERCFSHSPLCTTNPSQHAILRFVPRWCDLRLHSRPTVLPASSPRSRALARSTLARSFNLIRLRAWSFMWRHTCVAWQSGGAAVERGSAVRRFGGAESCAERHSEPHNVRRDAVWQRHDGIARCQRGNGSVTAVCGGAARLLQQRCSASRDVGAEWLSGLTEGAAARGTRRPCVARRR